MGYVVGDLGDSGLPTIGSLFVRPENCRSCSMRPCCRWKAPPWPRTMGAAVWFGERSRASAKSFTQLSGRTFGHIDSQTGWQHAAERPGGDCPA